MQQARTYRTRIGTVTHAPLPSSELLNYPDFSCSEDAVLHDRNHYVRTITPGGNDSACALAVPEETRAMVQPTQASAPTHVPESAHNLVSSVDGNRYGQIISRSVVSEYAILRTPGRIAEIPNPHVGAKNCSKVPEHIALATQRTVKDVLRPRLVPDLAPAGDKLVILACPLRGYCSPRTGREGAFCLRTRLETHDGFRVIMFKCSKDDVHNRLEIRTKGPYWDTKDELPSLGVRTHL